MRESRVLQPCGGRRHGRQGLYHRWSEVEVCDTRPRESRQEENRVKVPVRVAQGRHYLFTIALYYITNSVVYQRFDPFVSLSFLASSSICWFLYRLLSRWNVVLEEVAECVAMSAEGLLMTSH